MHPTVDTLNNQGELPAPCALRPATFALKDQTAATPVLWLRDIGPNARVQSVQQRQVAMHSHAASQGFTLLELLVVILIIGLLTGIVAPRFLGQINRSEAMAAKAQMDAFDKALQAYRIDTGRYPSTAQGLAALVKQPADEPRWRGPYLQNEPPADPWGSVYQYRAPGTNKDFELLSLGRDRAPGGQGDDADIVR